MKLTWLLIVLLFGMSGCNPAVEQKPALVPKVTSSVTYIQDDHNRNWPFLFDTISNNVVQGHTVKVYTDKDGNVFCEITK